MPESPALKTQFASDNTAGVCPEAWEAMARANRDYAPSYGTDTWTERVRQALTKLEIAWAGIRAAPLGRAFVGVLDAVQADI